MNPLAALRKLADEMRECDRTSGPCYAKDWASTLDSALRLLGDGEAVAFRCRRSNYNDGEWDYVDGRPPDSYELRECEIQSLYTVPPAVVVPEEWTGTESNPIKRSYWFGWNDCLAEIKRLNPERTNG